MCVCELPQASICVLWSDLKLRLRSYLSGSLTTDKPNIKNKCLCFCFFVMQCSVSITCNIKFQNWFNREFHATTTVQQQKHNHCCAYVSNYCRYTWFKMLLHTGCMMQISPSKHKSLKMSLRSCRCQRCCTNSTDYVWTKVDSTERQI